MQNLVNKLWLEFNTKATGANSITASDMSEAMTIICYVIFLIFMLWGCFSTWNEWATSKQNIAELFRGLFGYVFITIIAIALLT